MAAMQKELNVCFAPDNNYAAPCGAAIASIVENSSEGEFLTFHILHNNTFLPENIEKLSELSPSRKNFKLNFIKVDDSEFKDFPDYGHQPVWYRFKIPSLINAEKVLYLDCDVIALASLGEFFDIAMDGLAMCAVKDNIYRKLAKKYKLPPKQPYFNSGVVMMNCRYWREHKLESRFFDFIREDKSRAWLLDQNILNMLFGDKTKFVHLKYNFQYVAPFAFESCYIRDRKEYRQAAENPVVVHFFGPIKPWICGDGKLHPMQKLYFKYLALTPWKMSEQEWRKFESDNNKLYPSALRRHCIRAFTRNPQLLLKPYFWGRLFM